MPKPTLDNSLIVSIEQSPQDPAALQAIKASIPAGLYAWLSVSVTHIDPYLAWSSDWTKADVGIQNFKDVVNSYISDAKTAGIRFHLVVCSGLARALSVYADAKQEDVRNAQWYNDNNIASAGQIANPDYLSKYVFGTFSRYALKLRRNLEAKSRAMMAFLKQRMDQAPDVLVAVSGWGEAEFNFGRLDYNLTYPEFFCDYSPFAVLEFRDWLQHGGLYDDAAGIYAGQGYSGGGAKYAGAAGLTQFNADFGASFTTWNLKYYHWNLADGEGGAVPIGEYVQGGMMPGSGPRFIAGGFDPPRVVQPGNAFWDLWNTFREAMVRNLLLDMGNWGAEAGIDPKRWFTHQIPADYLFGTSRASEPKNPRYYASASPFWTADIGVLSSIGTTMYDVKFPDWFARTSLFLLPDAAARNARWAIMEYDAEVYPSSLPLVQSSSDFILEQYLKAYQARPSLINFWRWTDGTGESQIQGMNKEKALRELVRRIRDKAGSSDLTVVYSPPKVVGLTAGYVPTEGGVRTQIGGAIWADAAWAWKTWGDFSHFEVYRGDTADFPVDAAHKMGQTSDGLYLDPTAIAIKVYYYRWRAVNTAGVAGPPSDAVQVLTSTTPVPVLALDKASLLFGAAVGQAAPGARVVLVSNAGSVGTVLNWTASSDRPWIIVSPGAGVGNGSVSVSVNPNGLGAGTYTGGVEIRDPGALASPQSVRVELTVYEQGTDAPPLGRFDLPFDGANVASSIPVTGWALDDIEVAKVVIKLETPQGQSFISDALFVPGSRPDVEAAYPAYPNNDRAGWGYMLLTNFLPNGGNGTYVLHAYAQDTSGHETWLGSKTINCNNAAAVKPFGAIDLPAQGATVSGSAYLIGGWALTPPPNEIPRDGSTIMIWVDGQSVGRPSYNHYRDDIDLLFPGYVNSDGAVGVYYLNTTAYANGTHTIAWSVRDNAGNEDGIGSRYFRVLNVAAGAAEGGIVEPESLGNKPVGFLARAELAPVPWDIRPVYLRSGFDAFRPPETVSAGGDGAVRIGIGALEKLSLFWGESASARAAASPEGSARKAGGFDSGDEYVGYEVVGEQLRPLPIGSTLDARRGEFHWQPGPGFLGEFELVFLRMTDGRPSDQIRVRITIHPHAGR